MNAACVKALQLLKGEAGDIVCAEYYLFQSRQRGNQHIGRNRAYVLIKNAWRDLGYEGNVSCHSLRKTFGYHAWKSGISPAVIMTIYNHSSMEITKRYLAQVYQNIVL